MAIERTFCYQARRDRAQPDRRDQRVIEKAGLRIVAPKRIQMTRRPGPETFYAVQRPGRSSANVDFMTFGAGVVQVLEGENDVPASRRDGRDPTAKASDGTIRKIFAKSIAENSVHGLRRGRDAAIEIAQFFSGNEIVGESHAQTDDWPGESGNQGVDVN